MSRGGIVVEEKESYETGSMLYIMCKNDRCEMNKIPQFGLAREAGVADIECGIVILMRLRPLREKTRKPW